MADKDYVRAEIINWARSQCGKVSDRQIGIERKGWWDLKGYFTQACRWTDANWTAHGYIEGVKWSGYRVPQSQQYQALWNKYYQDQQDYKKGKIKAPPNPPPLPREGKGDGISWCGIFACWVLQRAWLQVYWVLGIGIKGPTDQIERIDRKPKPGELEPGDVCVIEQKIHHFIPIVIWPNGTMRTVEGNLENQSIQVRDDRNRHLVRYFYKVLP